MCAGRLCPRPKARGRSGACFVVLPRSPPMGRSRLRSLSVPFRGRRPAAKAGPLSRRRRRGYVPSRPAEPPLTAGPLTTSGVGGRVEKTLVACGRNEAFWRRSGVPPACPVSSCDEDPSLNVGFFLVSGFTMETGWRGGAGETKLKELHAARASRGLFADRLPPICAVKRPPRPYEPRSLPECAWFRFPVFFCPACHLTLAPGGKSSTPEGVALLGVRRALVSIDVPAALPAACSSRTPKRLFFLSSLFWSPSASPPLLSLCPRFLDPFSSSLLMSLFRCHGPSSCCSKGAALLVRRSSRAVPFLLRVRVFARNCGRRDSQEVRRGGLGRPTCRPEKIPLVARAAGDRTGRAGPPPFFEVGSRPSSRRARRAPLQMAAASDGDLDGCLVSAPFLSSFATDADDHRRRPAGQGVGAAGRPPWSGGEKSRSSCPSGPFFRCRSAVCFGEPSRAVRQRAQRGSPGTWPHRRRRGPRRPSGWSIEILGADSVVAPFRLGRQTPTKARPPSVPCRLALPVFG